MYFAWQSCFFWLQLMRMNLVIITLIHRQPSNPPCTYSRNPTIFSTAFERSDHRQYIACDNNHDNNRSINYSGCASHTTTNPTTDPSHADTTSIMTIRVFYPLAILLSVCAILTFDNLGHSAFVFFSFLVL